MKREQALSGIQNQAWDLCLIYTWMDDFSQTNSTGLIVIMASMDRALHSIARTVHVAGEDDAQTEAMRRQHKEREFISCWEAERGHRIMAAMEAAQARRTTHPHLQRYLTIEYTKAMVDQLEQELMNFIPA
jgi:hypothetical protein